MNWQYWRHIHYDISSACGFMHGPHHPDDPPLKWFVSNPQQMNEIVRMGRHLRRHGLYVDLMWHRAGFWTASVGEAACRIVANSERCLSPVRALRQVYRAALRKLRRVITRSE